MANEARDTVVPCSCGCGDTVAITINADGSISSENGHIVPIVIKNAPPGVAPVQYLILADDSDKHKRGQSDKSGQN